MHYHYTYDAVGNRLTQDTSVSGIPASTSYGYDDANRLMDVNGVTYTWDNNGNLLNDGVNTYTYTSNKLSSISGENLNVTFQYSGLGDRLNQTVNGVTTNYTLDLNAGLTQVLSDGTNIYVYGVDRIAQMNGGIPEYFLTDGIGSVRQLVDSTGNIALVKNYEPYGMEASIAGSGLSSYGFTGEMTDPTGLIYLRARYYASGDGRFLTKDTWMGDNNRPMSYNAWLYVYANPVNYTDPRGLNPHCLYYHRDLCAQQRFYEIVAKDPRTAGKNLLTLVALFEDQELQTLWGTYAGRTLSKRLEWILCMAFIKFKY